MTVTIDYDILLAVIRSIGRMQGMTDALSYVPADTIQAKLHGELQAVRDVLCGLEVDE